MSLVEQIVDLLKGLRCSAAIVGDGHTIPKSNFDSTKDFESDVIIGSGFWKEFQRQNLTIRSLVRRSEPSIEFRGFKVLGFDQILGRMRAESGRRLEYLGFVLFGIGCFVVGTFWKHLDSGKIFSFSGNYVDSKFAVDEGTEHQLSRFINEPENSSSTLANNGERIELCAPHMVNYVPCYDNFDRIRSVLLPDVIRRNGRDCPDESNLWFCLVPAPKRYRKPLPWPQSLNEVWTGNLPLSGPINYGISKKFLLPEGEKIKLLEHGDEHFVLQFLRKLGKTAPHATLGIHIKTALEIESGFSGVGAALVSNNVQNLLIATKDVYKDQVQISLERGLPAMLTDFGGYKLPFPSKAFDLIYCLKCTIDWVTDGGLLLLEANRMLRAGGYFVLEMEFPLKNDNFWRDMSNLSQQICWSIVEKKENVSIWRKPLDGSCYKSREAGAQPPLCDPLDNQDDVWLVKLKNCISPLTEHPDMTSHEKLYTYEIPNRLNDLGLETHTSKSMTFKTEQRYWRMVVNGYFEKLGWETLKFRNVMDMRAGFGGFAAALYKKQVNCWVMNVVPVSGPNTLPIIYDQGFVGTVHDWCEAFDTYPRTYDLIHAAGVFSIESKRCDMIVVLLEMDRILRPGAQVYVRDTPSVLAEVKSLAEQIGWKTLTVGTQEGSYGASEILICQKLFLHY